MHSYTELNRAIHSCTGLYTALHGYTQLNRGYTQLYRALHSCTGLYTAIQDYTQLYRAIQCSSELCGAMHRSTGIYTATHSYNGARRVCPCGFKDDWLGPIRARKVLVRYRQGMVAAVGDLEVLLFLSCLHCSAAAILLASWDFAPLWTAAHHFGLSIAACSHELWLMLKAFSDTLRLSLKSIFWPPKDHWPWWSSPNRSFSGSRWSGIWTTWLAQRSWVYIRMLWILGRLVRVSTSVSGILSCHFMPSSFLRLMVWKWFSFLAWHWQTVHDSQP